jgi:toxin-antitoxin system PIN domain toxin
MILADVNVLIYAFRRDTEEHDQARNWLDSVVQADALFGMSPLVLSAVVRIATNRRFYARPSSLDETLAFCDDLLAQEHCEVIQPGPTHWSIFADLCRSTKTVGPKVTDAWFAALAIESRCEWVTFDRDFARFPGLRWSTPL